MSGTINELKETGGSQSRRRLVIIITVIIALAVSLYLLLRRRAAETEATEAPVATNTTGTVKFLMEQQWLIKMKLALVEESDVARQITATGRVVPSANSQALVAPPVSGIITSQQLPRVGQRVSKGQAIALIQQTRTSAEEAQVRAAVAQAAAENARLEAERLSATGDADAARARLDLAEKDFARAKRLFQQQVIPQRELQEAEAELNASRATYDAAVKRRDALASKPPLSPQVEESYSSYTARAPLSSYVTKVTKSIGEQVAAGEAIIEITNLDTVWIEAPVFERDLSRLSSQVAATFTMAAYPDQEFRGRLLNVGAVIDEQTRAATVIFQVPNPAGALRIGMQANARLDAGESVRVMIIPRESVLEHEGKKIVYVLLSGEEFERREVTLGDEYGDKVAAIAGLKAGERVVTQGAYQLKLQELRPADAGAHTHET